MDAPKVDEADLPEWRTLWEEDRQLATPPQPGLKGRLLVPLKRFLRRFVTAPQYDLWERQRLYNLLIQHNLEARPGREQALEQVLRQAVDDLAKSTHQHLSGLQQALQDLEATRASELQRVHDGILSYIDSHEQRVLGLENVQTEGLEELTRHHEAVFTLLDHKVDQYRRQALELRAQLLSLLEAAETGGTAALATAVEEQGYLELERRHRGTEEEISGRIEPYLPFFKRPGEVLDLGCGRGEALELLREHGLPVRGVDSNAEMVTRCREKGLEVTEGDLFEALAATPAGSLGGVVSFHVIEHLPADAVERLVRLSWTALQPGGVLVLETPSPLSVVVGARNFWLDPTHQRPVHPDSLKLTFELAGFESVERIDRQPFAESARLPEVPTSDLSDEQLWIAHQVNLLRDRLDTLLFGFQDYGMVGCKPEAA